MFFYDYNFDTMYHITRKSAEEGLKKILTSRVKGRFNEKTSKKVIDDIMSNISIPNEYANDKCIYMSVDESELEGIRFSITASEIIKCKNPDTGNELIPIPLPKFKNKVDYLDLLPLNSFSILSDLADYGQKDGVIKQVGDLSNMTFSIDNSYKNLIAEQLEEVFTKAYAMKIASAIDKTISSTSHRFFLYRINNKKPVIYEGSRTGVCVVDTTSETSALSADLIMRVIKLYIKDITCIDDELAKIANKIHNMILYNIKYSKEELNNPYKVIKFPVFLHSYDMQFCFKKKLNEIDFKFRLTSYNWISDFICAPLKDIEWTTRYSSQNCNYFAPTYKGYRIVIPNTDMWVCSWPELDDDKIYIDGWTEKIIEDDKITLKGTGMKTNMSDTVITEDTIVYFMVVLDK